MTSARVGDRSEPVVTSARVGDRIAVIGCCGAGKSTLALKLGQRLGLPVVHLDKLGWEPGWIKVDRDELIRRQHAAFTPDGRWIADGNYRNTMDLRFAVADTIVFLDFPTHVCLYRILKRRIVYLGRTHPGMTPGNNERFLDREFPDLLRFVARFRRKDRPRILAKLAQLDGSQRVITLRSPHEVERFVASL